MMLFTLVLVTSVAGDAAAWCEDKCWANGFVGTKCVVTPSPLDFIADLLYGA